MPKFSATCLQDLLTPEHDAGRAARRAAYAKLGESFTHIVATEASDGSWCEFDATDEAHAIRLANNAVDNLGARGCSVWAIERDGSLVSQPSVYNIYQPGFFE